MTKAEIKGRKKGPGPEESGGAGLLRIRTKIVPLKISRIHPL